MARGPREHGFDLREPDTQVELGKQPGSPSWRTTLGKPDGPTVVIGARQVKARQVTEIVEHHRSHLRARKPPGTQDRT